MKYKPNMFAITKAVAKSGKLDWTVISGISEFLLNVATSNRAGFTIYHCGKPNCNGVFFLSANSKTPLVCPQCGEELSFEGGCNICKSCGWSKCE